MKVSVDAIKNLRDKTGAPMGDVRQALEASHGDEAQAIKWLNQKGFEAAQQRQSRATGAGRIESYVHHDGRVAALVEVNCETDFVARLPEFQQFCRDVAMQVASQRPVCIKPDELSSTHVKTAKGLGKTSEEFSKEVCLLEQPFIKDQGQTIGQLLTTLVAKTGENVIVRRFTRFGVGEE